MASKFTDTSNDSFHFSDGAEKPQQRLPPLRGYENKPLVTLEEATEPLIPYVPEIEHMVYTVRGYDKMTPEDGLTTDESASIRLYSMDWSPTESSFYIKLNETLRSERRESLLPPWLLFLRLFMTALFKIQSTPRIVFRGIKLDLRDKYLKGSTCIWWGFSSCTTKVEVLENNQFFGKAGTRSLFSIECNTGKSIKKHAFYPNEDEILLLPGREFEVIGSLDMANNLTMIHLKEIQPRFPPIAAIAISSNHPNIDQYSLAIETEKESTSPSSSQKTKKVAVKPPPPVELSYQSKKLTDTDMERVVNEALTEKKCTKLDLSYNKITHEGAAIVAGTTYNNNVRRPRSPTYRPLSSFANRPPRNNSANLPDPIASHTISSAAKSDYGRRANQEKLRESAIDRDINYITPVNKTRGRPPFAVRNVHDNLIGRKPKSHVVFRDSSVVNDYTLSRPDSSVLRNRRIHDHA